MVIKKKPKNIIIMGPQGSGKSTQAQMLAEELGLKYISTGAIFREISREGSELGKRVQNVLSKGLLVSDKDTMTIISRAVPENGFVVDGFPRNIEQAKVSVRQVDKVVYVAVEDKECTKRLLKGTRVDGKGVDRVGRGDDTPELIAKRLSIYHKETEPVLEYYRRKGLLAEIDGVGSIDEVFGRVRKALV